MNSAEFMALVEKHPLPWKHDDEEGGWTDAHGEWIAAISDHVAAMDKPLADAAPAMAAAAIKLLRAYDEWWSREAGKDQAIPSEMSPMAVAVRAIRASLPESLRE